MLLESLTGLVIFFIALTVMILVVPRELIKEYFGIGLVGGAITALILVYTMQTILNLWRFVNVDFLRVYDIPLFLSAAWFPIIIIFSYLINKYRQTISNLVILLSFPLGAAVLHYFMIYFKMLIYHNWSLLFTYLVSLTIHFGIMRYLYIRDRTENHN